MADEKVTSTEETKKKAVAVSAADFGDDSATEEASSLPTVDLPMIEAEDGYHIVIPRELPFLSARKGTKGNLFYVAVARFMGDEGVTPTVKLTLDGKAVTRSIPSNMAFNIHVRK